MEKSLFTFIWKYSKKDQITLLLITLLTFPIMFLALELPKRIINDAIGGSGADIVLLGFRFTQVQFLMLLCVGFILTVLISGLLKMRLNTMKGVLEPMGGLMGDMISQPILLAGQMLTILGFLFIQSFWFGLAAIALIPLQAWLIPKLQRKINLLNKSRIKEVRKLAADIGETAAGVSDIRVNGGLRYRMSKFSDRLGNLYDIRFEIFQKKFFMKFLNNFINQLTPFFFYAVGGYLVIIGEISIGALVAALGAYKDMSSPWKELLAYYNQTQDMSLRWEVITERFASKSLVDESLLEGSPSEDLSLKGDIEITDVTVRDEEGIPVLEKISLTIPQGGRVAIKTDNEPIQKQAYGRGCF